MVLVKYNSRTSNGMKREIELKFITKDFEIIRRQLKKLGAKLKWSGKEKNWYFDTSQNNLWKKGKAFRLRTAGKHQLTLKANSTHKLFKSADEYEISVSDAEETKKLLKQLGFRVWLAYTKTRECWNIRGADITLDSLPFGKFVEIESLPRQIRLLAPKLGLSSPHLYPKTHSIPTGLKNKSQSTSRGIKYPTERWEDKFAKSTTKSYIQLLKDHSK